MSTESMTLLILGQDEASSVLRGLQREIEKTKKLAEGLNKSFQAPGADFAAGIKAAVPEIDKAAKSQDRAFAEHANNFRYLSRVKTNSARAEARTAADQLRRDRETFKMRMRWNRSLDLEQRRALTEADRRQRAADRRRRDADRDSARTRNRIQSRFREAGQGFRQAGDRLQHPFFSSPAFVAISGLTSALLALKSSIETARSVDDAATRYRMFGNASPAETAAARSQALRESIDLGTGAQHLLNVQAEALQAGVPKEIASAMAAMIPKAAGAMGETAEMLAASMSEAMQQLAAMGAVKSPEDARRFLNVDAGMSNFGGMNATKMREFLDSGGLGHGRELGMNFADTLGLASAFGAMGARTGMYDARMLGQFSQAVPRMHDRWMKAVRSHEFSE
jgi:hypothetical protein